MVQEMVAILTSMLVGILLLLTVVGQTWYPPVKMGAILPLMQVGQFPCGMPYQEAQLAMAVILRSHLKVILSPVISNRVVSMGDKFKSPVVVAPSILPSAFSKGVIPALSVLRVPLVVVVLSPLKPLTRF